MRTSNAKHAGSYHVTIMHIVRHKQNGSYSTYVWQTVATTDGSENSMARSVGSNIRFDVSDGYFTQ